MHFLRAGRPTRWAVITLCTRTLVGASLLPRWLHNLEEDQFIPRDGESRISPDVVVQTTYILSPVSRIVFLGFSADNCPGQSSGLCTREYINLDF
jgi:hypothetical protein